MLFRTSETVSGGIEEVFPLMSDLAFYERKAIDAGLAVRRLDKLPSPAPGMQWEVPFRARGRDRLAEIELVKLASPIKMRFEGRVQGLLFETDLDCRVVDPDATEVTVSTKFRAKSITAKVLLQSMKLARGTLTKRYRERVQTALRELEDRLRATA